MTKQKRETKLLQELVCLRDELQALKFKCSTKYYIWSVEHQQYWKPDRLGYTRDIDKAGWYDIFEAESICARANLPLKDNGTLNCELDVQEMMIPARTEAVWSGTFEVKPSLHGVLK